MLMDLVWGLVRPFYEWIADVFPEPPNPVSMEVPYPAWLPSWPVTTALASVLLVAGFSLLVRLVRWLYGLVPVVQ